MVESNILDSYISYIKEKSSFFCEIANNEDKLFDEINQLKNTHKLDELIENYKNTQGPLNILRLTALKALKIGEIIDNQFVYKIKEKFNQKDLEFFKKYLSDYSINAIRDYSSKNGGNPFHSWKNNFTIFYTFFYNGELKDNVVKYLGVIGDELIKRLGLDGYTTRVIGFAGCQNQGQEHVWCSLYPSRLKNYINAIQIFFEIWDGNLVAGLYKGDNVRQDISLNEDTRKSEYQNFNDMLEGLEKQKELAIKLNNSIDELDIEEPICRYWIYSPGEQAKYWEDFYREGIMAIGWEYLGDLSNYSNKEEIREKLQKEELTTSSKKNDTLANWEFANKLKEGDIVYVKKGNNLIVGRGIVSSPYIYDESRDFYKSIRKVNWTDKGEWNSPNSSNNVVKALTDITIYTDYVDEIESLFESTQKTQIGTLYDRNSFLEDVYMDENKYDSLKELLLHKKNIILQGAPGVGKTFVAKRLAYSILGYKDTNKVKMVQFHQSFSYEDFIEGYRPCENGFKLERGIFYKFCKEAENDPENKYFFIIDEINRGKLSKILGELLMLIETDKRGQSLQLLYSHELFSVPNNLYIIGMMNTADRGLAMIDYALRRRFSFFKFEPAFENEHFKEVVNNKSNSKKLFAIINEIVKLNKVITEDVSLGDGFQIGHSYFCNDNTTIENEWLKSVIEYEIIPLISEYWFDEPEKLNEWTKKLRDILIYE